MLKIFSNSNAQSCDNSPTEQKLMIGKGSNPPTPYVSSSLQMNVNKVYTILMVLYISGLSETIMYSIVFTVS